MDYQSALDVLAGQGPRLREQFGFAWTRQTEEVVRALRFRMACGKREAGSGEREGSGHGFVVGVVGGASSGKSTVFNNLLGGRRASVVTIKSHATRGLILAAHRERRASLDMWLYHERLLLSSLAARPAERDTDLQGEPEAVVALYHDEPALRDVLLVDTPDFTSNAAQREGDITMAVLPWFDRLIVVVDHERWFDRQVADDLGSAAVRFGQQRMVVFNRTAQGELADSDRARLLEQARQVRADRVCILDYYPGRGFRRFGADVLRQMAEFLAGPGPDRAGAMRRDAACRAGKVLEVNQGRTAALERLCNVLARSADRLGPATWWECVTALMAPDERDRLDGFSRLLGLSQMRDWLDRQRRRLEQTMSKVPWLRLSSTPVAPAAEAKLPAEVFSREQSGMDFFDAQCERQLRRLNEDAAGSDFWDDVRRTTGAQPVRLGGPFTEALRPRARQAVEGLARALEEWDAKVQRECQGMSSPVVGSLGMAMIGIAAILVAVPGPISALTPVIAAGAIKAGLIKIGAAGLFGAVGGRPVARLIEIVREKLLASPEFSAVRSAAEALRQLMDEHVQAAAREIEQTGRQQTLARGEALLEALEIVDQTGA